MPENVQHCPLCAGDRTRLFDRREFRGLEVVNRLCLSCGFVYQSPRMTEAEAADFYEAEYRRLYQGDEGPDAKDLAVQRARADSLAGFVCAKVQRVSRQLDIGCSVGLLLQRLQSDYDCQSIGVEPGRAHRVYAREHGLTVYASLEELRQSGETPFDLISMVHVLEHLPDPIGYLHSLRETLLAPDGWLLLEVPNLYAHDCFETAHLVSYSAHTLTQVVEKARFEIVTREAHGHPRSDIVPYYLTLLARPAVADRPLRLRPETGVGFKRWFGLLRRRILSRLFPRRAWKNIG